MIAREILRKVRRIQIRTSHRVDELLAGSWSSVFRGRGIEFEEVRPYQVGDDVRTIDWNVTARSDQPYVKLFRTERELAVWMLVDVSASLDIGTHRQTKRELVTEIGATIALSAMKNNDKVGMTLFTDQIEKSIPARAGSRHALRLIRELLVHQPIGTGTDMAAALQHLQRTTHRRAVVFVISDFQGGDMEGSLRIAAQRHDVIPIIIRDRIENSLPNLGLLRVRDVETGRMIMIDTASRRHRDAYARMKAEQVAARDALLRRLKLAPLTLQTGDDLTEALRRYFDHR